MLDKNFVPADAEARLYALWEAEGAFDADPLGGKVPFAIMIPPPNVTGTLHAGHALNMTLQDILIRWRRMQGRDALWQPGTDHAGISTQLVVERTLRSKGSGKDAIGREAFIQRVWEWKQQSGSTITNQLRRLGCSLDWRRERFTMDEGLSEAVREVFVTLHRQGLIYRDRRLVNWDPVFRSALSDLEVESREVRGHLWHIRYPVEGMDGLSITVATTRPETLLGDTAVAVHPDDARYADLVGRHVLLPLTGRRVPIVADSYSDPEKGTGAVKITPAHDFNDFAVGQRHSLAMPTILDEVDGGDRPAHPSGAACRTRRRRGRAAPDHPVVLQCRPPGGTRDRGGGAGPGAVRAQAVGEHLLCLDARHPALVHQPAALVGAPHPCLVRSGRRDLRGP